MDVLQVFWGTAEGTGVVQSGEKEAEGGPYLSLTATWKEVVVSWVSVSFPK